MKTNNEVNTAPTMLTDLVKNQLAKFRSGQGNPVNTDWTDDRDKQSLQAMIGDVSITDNIVSLTIDGQTFKMPVEWLIQKTLYTAWKDGGYTVRGTIGQLATVTAGYVSTLHMTKGNAETTEISHPFVSLHVAASKYKGKGGMWLVHIPTESQYDAIAVTQLATEAAALGYTVVKFAYGAPVLPNPAQPFIGVVLQPVEGK